MSKSLTLLILELITYVLIFILPIFIYLIKCERVSPLEYLKLKDNSLKGIIIGISTSAVFLILLFIKNKYMGKTEINMHIGVFLISGILVGLLEEIPFRGFILQKINEKASFIYANIITTIIFVTLHIPKWSFMGTISVNYILKTAAVSLSFGYLFKEFKSLWVPIICHSVFDLSMLMVLQ